MKPKILTYQTYLQMIKNSRGTKMFRCFYVLTNGKKQDILKNGRLSCAFFVSSILKMFSLISSQHTTVDSTIKDMLKNGWRQTKKLKPGNVLVWEEKTFPNDSVHRHLGFFVGQNKAISNSSERGIPVLHHFTFSQTKTGQPKRKIQQIFTHPLLEADKTKGPNSAK
jgi:hypothetical protein